MITFLIERQKTQTGNIFEMFSVDKFQVPFQFQSSFTQIPLVRACLNPRLKDTPLRRSPLNRNILLPSLKIRNSSQINFNQTMTEQVLKERIINNSSTNTILLTEKKPLQMNSSQVVSRSSQTYSRYNEPNNRYLKYTQFLREVCLSNRVEIASEGADSGKKLVYSVGMGNNNPLITSILKSRFWWVEGSAESANFIWTQSKKQSVFDSQCSIKTDPEGQVYKITPRLVHNHLPGNNLLGNKKSLYQNLKIHCERQNIPLFDLVPLTFHIGPELDEFTKQFNRRQGLNTNGQKTNNLWIVKPGQNSNRGQNIVVIDSLSSFQQIMSKKSRGETLITQLYINKPFLYNRRKFDIRHYMLVTGVSRIKAYWYKDGYIRTSSQIFQVGDIQNQEMHLTNDAIQKNSSKYGKFQEDNKLSYKEFQRYLNTNFPDKKYDFESVLVKMKEIGTHAVKAVSTQLNPDRKQFNFEVFGLDFMIDEELRPWLIEVNTNPCIQVSCRVLSAVIPPMLENSFRLALDPLFPPPSKYPNSQKHNIPEVTPQNLKYQLIFDSDNCK